ncbi:MAG: type II toxin-antitoxin system VapC family toxin [Atopobiaceae bacterium]|nr:type II toxin-antitoxin system VapC family toxin [Atopobiaceae bacterium]
MSAKTLNIVCDTNVWIDAFIPSRQHCAVARELLVCATSQGHNLLYSGHSLVDVFYEVNREAKQWFRCSGVEVDETRAHAARAHAWSCIEDIHEVATAIACDEPAVWYALKLRALNEDLEDNFVLAAAQRISADYLVTSDARLRHNSNVATLSPENMLTVLKEGL